LSIHFRNKMFGRQSRLARTQSRGVHCQPKTISLTPHSHQNCSLRHGAWYFPVHSAALRPRILRRKSY
jgi:hypothetical protein